MAMGPGETQLREALLRPGVIWTEPSKKIQDLATPELMEFYRSI
jgi:hypothetical protein